ncbi:MAG: oxidoreductase, partial [Marinilabiliales bacterium]
VCNKRANELKPEYLMKMYTEVSLEKLNSKIDQILKGQLKGRTIINLEL